MAWLEHHRSCVPEERVIGSFGDGVIHDPRLELSTHEEKLDVCLFVREESFEEEPLAWQVDHTKSAVRKMDDSVCFKGKEPRVLERDPAGTGDIEQEVNVTTRSV